MTLRVARGARTSRVVLALPRTRRTTRRSVLAGSCAERLAALLLQLATSMGTDLSDLDLRGRSLEGARLPLSSFAGSDLRGVDFTLANLRAADLSRIRTGMSRSWTALVGAASLALSIAVGALSGIAGNFLHGLLASDDLRQRGVGVFVAVGLFVYLVVGMWKGLLMATRTVLPVVAAIAVAAGLVAVLSGVGTGIGALAVLAFILLAAVIVLLSVFARAVAGTAGVLFFAVVAISGALTGRALGGGLAALAVAVGAMIMARRSARHEDAFPLLARISTAIACRGGTSFRHADLSGALFQGARLVACDFRGAKLAGARFVDARIKLCRFDDLPTSALLPVDELGADEHEPRSLRPPVKQQQPGSGAERPA